MDWSILSSYNQLPERGTSSRLRGNPEFGSSTPHANTRCKLLVLHISTSAIGGFESFGHNDADKPLTMLAHILDSLRALPIWSSFVLFYI